MSDTVQGAGGNNRSLLVLSVLLAPCTAGTWVNSFEFLAPVKGIRPVSRLLFLGT